MFCLWFFCVSFLLFLGWVFIDACTGCGGWGTVQHDWAGGTLSRLMVLRPTLGLRWVEPGVPMLN